MSRRSAIALIVRSRNALLAHAEEHMLTDAGRAHAAAADLAQLLLDVRAGRVSTFELNDPTRMRVLISAD